MVKMISCFDINQKRHLVPAKKFRNRVAVYLMVFDEEATKILLVKIPCGKYYFPGGEKEPGEEPEEAGRRELLEETGLSVEVGEFVGYHRSLLYSESDDDAMDNLGLYFTARVIGKYRQPYFDANAHDDPIVDVVWLKLDDLKPEMMILPEVFWMIAKAKGLLK
ncbi:TPA: hypothetical protein DF272_04550 [Candidatus Falkowbacteria bacterium]|nr:hypothetical protein [Candidatus Falkowbacteria bacterium]